MLKWFMNNTIKQKHNKSVAHINRAGKKSEKQPILWGGGTEGSKLT